MVYYVTLLYVGHVCAQNINPEHICLLYLVIVLEFISHFSCIIIIGLEIISHFSLYNYNWGWKL